MLGAALALCGLPVQLAASAPAPTVPTAPQIIQLCPGLGLALMPGAFSREQDTATMAQVLRPAGHFASFTDADIEFSPWSDRLAAVTWRASSPDGATNAAWLEQMLTALESDGWRPSTREGLSSPLAMNPVRFERAMQTAAGERTYYVEIDTRGILLLRCGEVGAMELARAEQSGELAPGSPRPPRPERAIDAVPLPQPGDCSRPEVASAFARIAKLEEIGPTFEAVVHFDDPAAEHAAYARRLNTWIRWRLKTAGLNEDRLWSIEDAAPGSQPDLGNPMEGVILALGAIADAQKAGDRTGICTSGIALMRAQHADDLAELAALDVRNAALEAEARRVGIALD